MIRKHNVEQLNPNDTEFIVNSRSFVNGDHVSKEQVLFEVEGQKTAFDVLSESDGYVYSKYEPGEYIGINKTAYYVADEEDEFDDLLLNDAEIMSDSDLQSETNPSSMPPELVLKELSSPLVKVAVAPGGKAYRQVEDALSNNKYIDLVGYFDDAEHSSHNRLGPIDIDKIESLWRQGSFDRMFVATGNSALRTNILNQISDAGIGLINIIHPTAYVSETSTLGSNIFVGPQSSIGSKSVVNSGCFLSGFSNIEHHCYLDENTLLGPGVMLSGSVRIGSRSLLGAGVAVESNINIGSDVYVAPGKGISKHLPDGSRIIAE